MSLDSNSIIIPFTTSLARGSQRSLRQITLLKVSRGYFAIKIWTFAGLDPPSWISMSLSTVISLVFPHVLIKVISHNIKKALGTCIWRLDTTSKLYSIESQKSKVLQRFKSCLRLARIWDGENSWQY